MNNKAVNMNSSMDIDPFAKQDIFQQVFEGAAQGMVIHLKGGSRRISVNKAFCDMVGYDEQTLLDEPYELLTHPEDLSESLKLRQELFSGATQAFQIDKRYLHKNGDVVWGAVNTIAIRDDDGEVLYFISYIQNVTPRKMAEDDLIKAKEQADLASRSKTEFLANMSHELRTPLNSILGFSDLINADVAGVFPVEKYRQYAGDINTSGTHLLNLINDILDVSKIESGAMSYDERWIDINEKITSCLRMVEEIARSGGVELTCSSMKSPPSLLVDPTRFKQIILNLLSNAIKFTEPGGSVEVRVSVSKKGRLWVQVFDTGIGINDKHIKRIQQPFQQVDQSSRLYKEGTGLGLALVKSLIEDHKGTLYIESELDKGTMVRVCFPPTRLQYDKE